MPHNCFVATYVLATYVVFKKHIISAHSLQILYADRYPIFTDKILHVEIIQTWCFFVEKEEKRTFRHEMFSFWLIRESSSIQRIKESNPYLFSFFEVSYMQSCRYVFKPEGADSNGLLIYISVLFNLLLINQKVLMGLKDHFILKH